MGVLRPSAVLLLSCVLLAGASFVRVLDVFSTGPLSESPAPSRLSCAAWCDRKTGCLGFTLTTHGSCQLFDSLLRSTADTSATVPVSYTRPPVTPCPSGWLLYHESCYLRKVPSIEQGWNEYRSACQGLADNADLATPNDEAEVTWMVYHPSRPSTKEYIGLKTQNGALVNMDGTAYSLQLRMYKLHAETGCVNLVRLTKTIRPFNALNCTIMISGYICESPLRCLYGTPCPAGWLALDDYCYHYVSTAQTWQDADQHCTGLQPGARLSPVINMGTWRILYQHFGTGSYIFVGISDLASEGSFQSIDGTDWSVTWFSGGQDGGTDEDCVKIADDGADDASCQDALPFICRVRTKVC